MRRSLAKPGVVAEVAGRVDDGLRGGLAVIRGIEPQGDGLTLPLPDVSLG